MIITRQLFNKFYSYLSEEIVNLPIVSREILSGTYSNKIPFVGQNTATEIFLTDFDYTNITKQLLDTSFNKYLNQNITSSILPIKTLKTLKNPVNKPLNKPLNIPVNKPLNIPLNIPVNKPLNTPANKPLNIPANTPVNNKSVKYKPTSEVQPENIQQVKTKKKDLSIINASKYGWDGVDYSKLDNKIMEGHCV